jgi:hypothetical protein
MAVARAQNRYDLRFADAVGRLNLGEDDKQGLPDLLEGMTGSDER